jgi:outer membrane protein assembly factor BamB
MLVRMRKQAVLFLVFALLGSIVTPFLSVKANSSSDDWPMFNHDLSHTGYSTSTAPKTNKTLWTFTTGGAVETSPAVVNGVVYVGSDDGYVYALNAANGSLIWKYNTYGPVQSSPAVVDGLVYIGGYHSHAVFALDAYTGELVWSSPTDSIYPNKISSTAVANGLVYVAVFNSGAAGGEFYALNASTGNLVWKYAPGAWISSSPAVYGGKVYIGTSTDRIVALDAISGDISWRYFVTNSGPTVGGGSPIYSGASSLSISDGLVYIGTTIQTVQAWDASTGAFVWSGDINGAVYASTVAVANGVVYASTGLGGTVGTLQPPGVTALNAESGALLWNNSLGSIQYSSPAVADGMVFVGSDAGPPNLGVNDGNSVYALDADTGATIWTYETGGEVWSSPAVAYGVVYVGSNDAKVYAIGTNQNIPPPSVPEFPAWIVLPPLIIATLFTAIFLIKKRKRQNLYTFAFLTTGPN